VSEWRECRIGQNSFERWILINSENPSLAWSGLSWVPIDEDGFPAGDTQVSNLDTYSDAVLYATECGLLIQRPS
jgi:hypothetical protein